MPITDKSTHENFIRGADTFWHKAAMLNKNILRVVFAFLFVWAAISLILFVATTDKNIREAAIANRKAVVADLFFLKNMDIGIELGTKDGGTIQKDVPARQLKEMTAPLYNEAKGKLFGDAFLAFFAAGFIVFSLVSYQVRRGGKLADDEFLRGAKIVSEETLAGMVKKPSSFKIGKVPIPQDKLLRNILMTGAMGTGKSQALLYLLDEARKQGIKCVVYDKTGEFTEQYFRDGQDVLLNPFDTRCAQWSLFEDIKQDFDYSTLSAFFVPENKNSSDPVWDNAARILLEDVFRIVHSFPHAARNMTTVQKIILRTPLDELAQLLRDHGAAASGTINEKNEHGSESVRLSLAASPAIKYFNYLPTPQQGASFSIREWINKSDDRWLFLTSRADMHEVIKPFTSLWVELALMSVMMRRPDHDKLRAMFFLDELASLSKMRGLEIAVTEARKYGICSVVGLQNMSQIDHLYGNDMAKVLAGNFQTKLILRVEDESTAKRYADQLGKEEVLETGEGNSFGAEASRDGVNISSKRTERHIVMPAEIGILPDLVGFLKLPGDFPIGKVKIQFKSRPMIAPDFIPRSGFEIVQVPQPPAPAPALDANEKTDLSDETATPIAMPIKKRNRAAARIEKAGFEVDEIPREDLADIIIEEEIVAGGGGGQSEEGQNSQGTNAVEL